MDPLALLFGLLLLGSPVARLPWRFLQQLQTTWRVKSLAIDDNSNIISHQRPIARFGLSSSVHFGTLTLSDPLKSTAVRRLVLSNALLFDHLCVRVDECLDHAPLLLVV